MTGKTGFPLALILGVLCVLGIRGQDPASPEGGSPSAEGQSTGSADMLPAPSAEPPGQLSKWITYTRPDCCGPIGANGSVHEEVYLRTGPDFVLGGSRFANALNTEGWTVEGGGRALFFNPAEDSAWTVDLGMTYTYNHNDGNPLDFVVTPFLLGPGLMEPSNVAGTPSGTPLTIDSVNRTSVNLSLGREWYLLGPARCGELNCRAGFDVGGRWGMARADFYEHPTGTTGVFPLLGQTTGFQRHGHSFTAAFFAVHSDVEYPLGCCILEAGLRAEIGYSWMDRLLEVDTNIADLNLLMTLGVRF